MTEWVRRVGDRASDIFDLIALVVVFAIAAWSMDRAERLQDLEREK